MLKDKELHVYYDLGEDTITDSEMDELYVNCAETQRAIENEFTNIVRTTDLTTLIDTWSYIDAGWKVFVHANGKYLEARENMNGTIKDINRGHNILKLLMGGEFDILPYGAKGYDE